MKKVGIVFPVLVFIVLFSSCSKNSSNSVTLYKKNIVKDNGIELILFSPESIKYGEQFECVVIIKNDSDKDICYWSSREDREPDSLKLCFEGEYDSFVDVDKHHSVVYAAFYPTEIKSLDSFAKVYNLIPGRITKDNEDLKKAEIEMNPVGIYSCTLMFDYFDNYDIEAISRINNGKHSYKTIELSFIIEVK